MQKEPNNKMSEGLRPSKKMPSIYIVLTILIAIVFAILSRPVYMEKPNPIFPCDQGMLQHGYFGTIRGKLHHNR